MSTVKKASNITKTAAGRYVAGKRLLGRWVRLGDFATLAEAEGAIAAAGRGLMSLGGRPVDHAGRQAKAARRFAQAIDAGRVFDVKTGRWRPAAQVPHLGVHPAAKAASTKE